MPRAPRRGWPLAILAAIALLVVSCGTDVNTPATGPTTTAAGATQASPSGQVDCAQGTLSGAGATFPQTIVQQWIKDYVTACPGATINYQGVGSGAGIEQFTAKTVDFGASDAIMKPEEQQRAESAWGGPVLQVPWTAGAIAVMYKLSGVKNLKLSPQSVAGIFSGRIRTWNDPLIVADNGDATLPAAGIQVVHRSDGSGTTNAFTSYLTANAPSEWKAGAGKDVPWPTGQGAKGSDGVTAAVKQTEGAIGYAELSFAKANGLGIAMIKNKAGAFVAPNSQAVTAALKSAQLPDDLKVRVSYAPTDPGAYPISTTTWALVAKTISDSAKARLARSFLVYALGPGQQAAERLDYAPLPQQILSKATAAVRAIGG